MSSEVHGIPGHDFPEDCLHCLPFWWWGASQIEKTCHAFPPQQLRQLLKDVDILQSHELGVISSGASLYVPECNNANPMAIEFTCFICSEEKDQQNFGRGWRAAYQAMSTLYQFCTPLGRQKCDEISPYIKAAISKMQPNLRWLQGNEIKCYRELGAQLKDWSAPSPHYLFQVVSLTAADVKKILFYNQYEFLDITTNALILIHEHEQMFTL